MSRPSRWMIRAAARLVTADQRPEWREEWEAELAALEEARDKKGGVGLPSELWFAIGSVPHALWTRREGWTMDGLLNDLKHSARVLRFSPGFTLIAALTLALGIGANASIFSLVNGLMLRPPAEVHEPDRLVQIARSYETDPRWDNFSWPAYRFIRDEGSVFSGVAGYTPQSFTVGEGARAARLVGQEVTGNFFEVVGVRPALGRLLQARDDVAPGAHRVTVLSHALWTERYGADPEILGRSIILGSESYEVVGVAPAGFTGLEAIGTPPSLWVPTMQHPPIHDRLPFEAWGWSWLNVVGRLGEDVSLAGAEAAMETTSSRLRELDSVNEGIRVVLASGVGLDPASRAEARGLAGILALIASVVLLLTCTNVANLLLARGAGRRTEVSVRKALGAGRGRLVRQLVAESFTLAALATLLTVPLVLSADRFVPLLFPYSLSVSLHADGTVFAFLAAIGLAAGLLFGIVPAWSASKGDVSAALRLAGTTGGRSRTRLRDFLVVVQLGLSLALVACAALLGRSVVNASAAQPGFDPTGLAIGLIDVQSTGRYSDEESRELLSRLIREVESAPGVARATVANSTPIITGQSRSTVRPAGEQTLEFEAEYVIVGPGYFETLGIPLLQGRPLGGYDEEPEPVVVVNEALARMFWPGEDPIGKELAGSPPLRVVGVAGDVQARSLRSRPRPGVYYTLEHASARMVLHARGTQDQVPSVQALSDAVASVDPGMPVRVVNLQEGIAQSMGETRTIGGLIAAFAGLALLLAAVGLYGLVSYGASQRVREIGIRIALGAEPRSLVRLILARGLAVALIGVGGGLLGAAGLARALDSLLFQVEPGDPWVFLSASATLLTIAALAAWIPARRASRTDAAVSLRD